MYSASDELAHSSCFIVLCCVQVPTDLLTSFGFTRGGGGGLSINYSSESANNWLYNRNQARLMKKCRCFIRYKRYTVGSPNKETVRHSCGFFYVVSLDKLLNKQSRYQRFYTPLRSCGVPVM